MATKVNGKDGKPPPSVATNLMAGGAAGMMEALVCHPLGKRHFSTPTHQDKHQTGELVSLHQKLN